jgi:hypothetical protein
MVVGDAPVQATFPDAGPTLAQPRAYSAGVSATDTLLIVTTALVLAGCGGGGSESVSDTPQTASCAFVVEYSGHRYLGNAAPVRPVEGKPLGVGIQPGCQDAPGGPESEDREVGVAEIEGVSPALAILIRGRDESILIRDDADYQRLPPEVARLLSAPSCHSGEQPVEITGRWLGILGADGNTELDLAPPYDLRIEVTKSSLADYARAELTIRVPTTLGRPLTRRDIESSLEEDGILKISLICRDGDFVASAVKAGPE